MAGRPAKFKSVEELQKKIDEYFESCFEVDPETGKKTQVKPFTITGLALALDTTRETLMDVENGHGPYSGSSGFSDAIKRAKLRCQNYAEEKLFSHSPTGAIFALKNYGWSDKTEINSKILADITIKMEGDADDWSR
jgi:hypothetical protein